MLRQFRSHRNDRNHSSRSKYCRVFDSGTRRSFVPRTPQYRKSRIFREPGIGLGKVAEIEDGTTLRFHASHEPAVRTKPDAGWILGFLWALAHPDSISRASAAAKTIAFLFAILVRYARSKEHRGHCKRHEHHLHGDVSAHHGRKLS